MRVLLIVVLALPLHAADALQWSGFAALRGATVTDAVPLDDDTLSAQVQLGVDWTPSPFFGAHVHLLARSEDDRSDRGRAGVVQAYVEQNLARGEHRVRFTEGAFFLATSRENIDALWESPYTISSSALNTWLGEELRPIGVDAAYTFRRSWTAGVTLFRGNETFGELIVDRGWMLHDRWTLLGEHVRSNDEYAASVSSENDGRLGWAARGRWNSDRASVQLTHIDNRSDGLEYGRLLNWDTQFDIAGGDFTAGDWNFAAEVGWGTTVVVVEGVPYASDIAASYVLASRRFAHARATLRVDDFRIDEDVRHAFTAAIFWTPRGRFRPGMEAIVSEGESRVAVDLRYSF